MRSYHLGICLYNSNYISFDCLICTFNLTMVAQTLDIFSIETAMFSRTLSKRSAVNNQECETEPKALV